MDDIGLFLEKCWLNSKESHVYVTVWKQWSNPASSIARLSWFERVWTYKTLQKFVAMGIMAESVTKWVTHFRIPSIELLQAYINRHQETRDHLGEQFPYIKSAFMNIPNHQQVTAPKIQLFEQTEGIRFLFDDMLHTITNEWLISIKIFATNTFETQMLSNTTIKTYAQDFFSQVKSQKILISSFIAEWSLIMEQLISWEKTAESIDTLPAWNNAVNLFLIWKTVYIIIYKELPIWLKLESPEFAWAMHFLLEQTAK